MAAFVEGSKINFLFQKMQDAKYEFMLSQIKLLHLNTDTLA